MSTIYRYYIETSAIKSGTKSETITIPQSMSARSFSLETQDLTMQLHGLGEIELVGISTDENQSARMERWRRSAVTRWCGGS